MLPESRYRAMVRTLLRGVDPFPLHIETLLVDMLSAVAIEQQEHDASLIRDAADEYGALDVEQCLRLADVVENHYRDEHGQTRIQIRADD